MKHGCNWNPASPRLADAIDYASVKVGGAAKDTDWFGAWNWRANGDALGNDELGCCCEVADLVLVEGFRASLGLSPLSAGTLTELVKLRYSQVAGWSGPATDSGSDPAEDAFSWQASPIFAAARNWNVRWLTVRQAEVFSALRRGPLLLTIALTADDKDDPDLWGEAPDGPRVEEHRVVCGAGKGGLLISRTYGLDVPVSPARVLAADLLLPVDLPAELRSAGIDWTAVG